MLELIFRHDGHVTQKTFRFKEVHKDPRKMLTWSDAVVGTLYVKKTAFDKEIPPDEITVKLEW